MVSVLSFYPNDPSSNPAGAYIFYGNFVFEKNEINKQRPGLAHFIFKKSENIFKLKGCEGGGIYFCLHSMSPRAI